MLLLFALPLTLHAACKGGETRLRGARDPFLLCWACCSLISCKVMEEADAFLCPHLLRCVSFTPCFWVILSTSFNAARETGVFTHPSLPPKDLKPSGFLLPSSWLLCIDPPYSSPVRSTTLPVPSAARWGALRSWGAIQHSRTSFQGVIAGSEGGWSRGG